MTRREPWAWPAAITPWNFPMSMLPRKVAPALAAGCTVVAQARQRHALQRPGPGRAGPARGPARGRAQRAHGRGCRHWRRNHRQPSGAQAEFYRLHRRGQGPGRPVRPYAQAPFHGTGRQRPLHRLCRCGFGPRCKPGHGPASSATPGRPASAPTAFWWSGPYTISSPRPCWPRCGPCAWATGLIRPRTWAP